MRRATRQHHLTGSASDGCCPARTASPSQPARVYRGLTTGFVGLSEVLADAAGQDTRRAAMRFVLTHNLAISTLAVFGASRSKGDTGAVRHTRASVTELGGTACS